MVPVTVEVSVAEKRVIRVIVEDEEAHPSGELSDIELAALAVAESAAWPQWELGR